MVRLRLLALLLFVAPLLLPLLPDRSAADAPAYLLISEVFYDALQSGTDTQYEFLEIHNPTGAAVDLAGWRIQDNAASDAVPGYLLAPGETLVIAATASGFFANHPGFTGPLVTLEGSIGDGLNNAADRLILLDPAGISVDALSYGNDASAFDPPCPDVLAGFSLERKSVALDTDTAADWQAQPAPSPGAIPAVPAPNMTPSATSTGAASPTSTATYTVTPSLTPVEAPTPSATPLPGATGTPTATPSATATETPFPATATATAPPTATRGPVEWPRLLLSEVMYDAPQAGTDSPFEWIEVYNASSSEVNLAGWRVADRAAEDAIPGALLPPGEFLVIAGTASGFFANHPGYRGRLVTLEGTIGDGLTNTGDAVLFLAPDGTIVDAMSYGDDGSIFDPPCPDVAPGWSLARMPPGADADTSADWQSQEAPHPGLGAAIPTATPTATPGPTLSLIPSATPTTTATMTPAPGGTATASPAASPTPSPAPLPRVRLNEVLPRPMNVDWDGNGVADAYDEWIEVLNLEVYPVDLGGWALDDIASGGTAPYEFPAGTLVEAGGYLVRYRSGTGVALNQDADTARLVAPDGVEMDTFSYVNPAADQSYSRAADGTGPWVEGYPPSPGGPNIAPPSTATAVPASTPTATAISIPSPSPTSTVALTPTGTPSLGQPGDLVITEIMQNPSAVADAAGEWFEVYNASTRVIDLNGWTLRDDSADEHRIAVGGPLLIQPGGYLVLGREADSSINGGAPVDYQYSGFLLANDADEIVLLDGAGQEIDRVVYDGGAAFPNPDGASMALLDVTLDNAVGASWGASWSAWPGSAGDLGSPGVANPPPPAPSPTLAPTMTPVPTATATAGPLPRVRLNEVLPRPVDLDWDGNGVADAYDEWIEVYNLEAYPVDLGGWALDDIASGGTTPYEFPAGTMLGAYGYLVRYRSGTGVALNQDADTARLLSPGGAEVDAFSYANPAADQSYSRAADGTGPWVEGYSPSPGGPNIAPPSTPTLTPTVTVSAPPTATPTPSPSFTPAITPAATGTPGLGQPGDVVITEIMYDPAAVGDAVGEWFEVYNTSDRVIDLNGWMLRDDGVDDHRIQAGGPLLIAPGGYLLLGREADVTVNGGAPVDYQYSGFLLANEADEVVLLDGSGIEVDRVAYDGGATFTDPVGASIALLDVTLDNAVGASWGASRSAWPGSAGDLGSPGAANPLPTAPTLTATAAPAVTPIPTVMLTATPLPRVRLNEVLPRPMDVDWDGDGVADAYDEWIEVYNLEAYPVDLGGWALDDIASGGTAPYEFPAGTLLEAHGYLVQYRSGTGVALNQDADTARLLSPDGSEADAFAYANPATDQSYSRAVDGIGPWVESYLPSPGGPNIAPPPTATPTATLTPMVTSTATATAAPTATGTPGFSQPGGVIITEIMQNPAAVPDAAGEWLEIYNASGRAIDLNGWTLRDGGSDEHRIAADEPLLVVPGDYLVLGREADAAVNGGAPVDYQYSGFLLANDADEIILLDGGGREIDRVAYDGGDAFPDPSGASMALLDLGSDNSIGANWGDSWSAWPGSAGDLGSPGAANPLQPTPTPTATALPSRTPSPTATLPLTVTPTATPSPPPTAYPAGITLNEILPDPYAVDWDANGVADFRDEWIELFNAGAVAAALGGWRIADDAGAYTLPQGTVIWPRAYLLLFRAQTGLSLGDAHDAVALVRPDGSQADAFDYARGPGDDRSFCRGVDGSGGWTGDCEVTPGRPNRLLPEREEDDDDERPSGGASGPSPAARTAGEMTIAAARALPQDTRVTLTGVVTLPPGLFGRSIYIQDATGGARIYLRHGEYPQLVAGDLLRVTGWTRDYHGEMEISVPDAGYMKLLGKGTLPAAVYSATGRVGEAQEGQLALVTGRIVKYEPNALLLDDGSGALSVYFPGDLPWRRPYVYIGDWWTARGVVGQYAAAQPYAGGYRLIPRFVDDVAPSPAFLPVTGSAVRTAQPLPMASRTGRPNPSYSLR